MNDSKCCMNMSGKLINKFQCNVKNSVTTFLKCNYKYKRRVQETNCISEKIGKNHESSSCLFINFIENEQLQQQPARANTSHQIIGKMLPIMFNDNANKHEKYYNKVSTQLLNINNNDYITDYSINSKIEVKIACLARCVQQAWQHSPKATIISNDMSLSQHPRQISSLAKTLSMSTRRRLSFNWMTTTLTNVPTTKPSPTPAAPSAIAYYRKTTTSRVNLMSILMTLFIALVLTARAVQGRFTFI